MEPARVADRFFHEVWNQCRLDVLDEIVDPACVTHQLRSAPGGIGTEARGPVALREHIQGWLAAFPDITVTVDLRCADGPYVVTWATMRGHHRGAWQGVPPTGREVTIRTTVQHRVEAGRIVEDWVIIESLGFMQQLGLVRPTAELLAQGREVGG